jgi:adenosine deaminase
LIPFALPVRKIVTVLIISSTLLVQGCVSENEKSSQRLHNYFESIRNNEALLTAFFSEMPKGGDLHNHFSGSVYAETYWNYLLRLRPWFDTVTLAFEYDSIKLVNKKGDYRRYKSASQLIAANKLSDIKQRILQAWSVKDYVDLGIPSHKHFFDTFGKLPSGGWNETGVGLQELQNRAARENVQYLELMLRSVPSDKMIQDEARYSSLLKLTEYSDTLQLHAVLDSLTAAFKGIDLSADVKAFNEKLLTIHNQYVPDNNAVTIRYQTYVNRRNEPVKFFRDLLTAFEAAQTNTLVTGLNILSPEHGDVSMRDYKLHMYMFRYCSRLYNNTVKYSMHAGELTLGLVKPEDLTFHIQDAVYIAGADRIGHGVDMAYESDNSSLLRYMAANKIAIEINLYSNEFILQVKEDKHPVSLYRKYQVPIVISTDDAGILRSNLVHQYVLLAKRYPQISYAEIKHYIRNSITYSFIKETELKQSLQDSLSQKIGKFEERILHDQDLLTHKYIE